MKVHYYYPYIAKDGKHKFYIITKTEKKYILGLLAIQILRNIKTKQGNKDILNVMRKTKIGLNLE